MESLSDKLKSLGVRVGADQTQRRPVRKRYPIESVFPGMIRETPRGEAFILENRIESDTRYGNLSLVPTKILDLIAKWMGNPEAVYYNPYSFAFLDTETTGLSGGTGTYAFLIGVGRYTDEGFQVVQFFLRDPGEESAVLAALESYLNHCEVLVTFNGKSFDVPLLNARYITNGWPPHAIQTDHLDLLHLARRLWRDRLPSRALGQLEINLLGVTRTEEDVPGWLIPQMYIDYLHSGDARPLKNVFYHNLMDVVSMAALLQFSIHVVERAVDGEPADQIETIAVARLCEDLGDIQTAIALYQAGLLQKLPLEVRENTLRRLSFLFKREGNFPAAIEVWNQAAQEGYVFANVELAKYFEHRVGDMEVAVGWTESALTIVRNPEYGVYARMRWEQKLLHRLARLKRRLEKNS